MKTDLSKILSISGQHGLYLYLAQARAGAIVENLSDKKRTVVDAKNRITTLEDISIYTSAGETKLREVMLKMKEVLGDNAAPSPKADPKELKDLFKKALPDYDGDRFYEIPGYPPHRVVDATGCGDTYAAGYLYARALGASCDEAGHLAAAMCTLKLEHTGPFDSTIEAVRKIVG